MVTFKSKSVGFSKASPSRSSNHKSDKGTKATDQGRTITGPTDYNQHKARKTSPNVSPSNKIPVDPELDDVDMSLDVGTSDDVRSFDVDTVDTLDRSLGERAKRRSRSESPSRETHTRTHYNQDIRSALFRQFGNHREEERAAKYQGVGSPYRGKQADIATMENMDRSDHAQEDSEDNHKSIEGVLNRTKIFLSGTFDTSLEDLRDEITENGGRVSRAFTEDVQLVVIGENPAKQDTDSQRRWQTRGTTLRDLRKVIEGLMPLSDISVSTSKVTFDTTVPLSYVLPYTQTQPKQTPRTVFPKNFPTRVPISRTNSPQLPSTGTNHTLISPQVGGTTGGLSLLGTVKKAATFKHTTILTARMRFSQAEKPDEAIQEAVRNLLTVFKEVDPAVKFRHLERNDKVYATRDDIPPLRYMYDTMVYFNGAKPASLQPYSNPKEDRMRNVSFTIRVGSNSTMRDILEECTWTLKDVVKGGDIYLEIKPLQKIKTETAFVLIAVPTNCSGEDLSKTLREFIQSGVNQAKRKKPEKYKYLPHIVPQFALTTEFIKGIPYAVEDKDKSDNIPIWMRKPWHIMIGTEDNDDFKLCVSAGCAAAGPSSSRIESMLTVERRMTR